MRDIRFRAWDIKGRTWVEYFGIENSTGRMFENEANYMPFEDFGNFVLMQYTGLKDKNGKEIYEGDIVSAKCKNDYGEQIGAIEYVAPNFGIKISAGTVGFWENESEVIGNIYENPELLKGEDVEK